ncbi:hypothetical protein Tco_1181135 [Tanacetum coccineum]
MDSRGSYHITYMRDYFVNFKEYDGDNILLGDGRECRVRGTGKVQVQMRDGYMFVLDQSIPQYVPELRRNLISLGTLEKDGFTVKMQSSKIKVKKGSLMVLSGTRRSNCVYTLDGQAVTRNTLQEVYTTMNEEWGRKHLVLRLQQHNTVGLRKQTTTLCVVAQIRLKDKQPEQKTNTGNKLWRLDDVTSKVVLYMNMGYNESGEYKKNFIGSGAGTGSMKVLHGFEFEVEPLGDHTFEVEPQENDDQ